MSSSLDNILYSIQNRAREINQNSPIAFQRALELVNQLGELSSYMTDANREKMINRLASVVFEATGKQSLLKAINQWIGTLMEGRRIWQKLMSA